MQEERRQGERRQSERHDSVDLLDYVVVDPDGEKTEYSMGRSLNISEAGILMETSKKLSIGSLVIITLDLGEELIEVQGKVVYINYSADRYKTGVRFLNKSEHVIKALKTFIQTLGEKRRKRREGDRE